MLGGQRAGLANPVVLEHAGGREARGGRALEQRVHEVARAAAQASPVARREAYLPVLDLRAQLELAPVAVLAAPPAAVGAAVGHERRVAHQQPVHDHACARTSKHWVQWCTRCVHKACLLAELSALCGRRQREERSAVYLSLVN